MKNLIGHDVENWREALDDPNAKLHLYGKDQNPARPQDGPRHPADPARLNGLVRAEARAGTAPA